MTLKELIVMIEDALADNVEPYEFKNDKEVRMKKAYIVLVNQQGKTDVERVSIKSISDLEAASMKFALALANNPDFIRCKANYDEDNEYQVYLTGSVEIEEIVCQCGFEDFKINFASNFPVFSCDTCSRPLDLEE